MFCKIHFLFEATVLENIRYGKLDATDEEVIEAAKQANAHSFISRLEDGYETVLTADGGEISQGQKQLLSIARALVADPVFLLLDEATSSIDTVTELEIQEALDRLMEGRTSFVIAHRLNTVRKADTVYVMEQGKLIEFGNQEELIERQGVFYNMLLGIESKKSGTDEVIYKVCFRSPIVRVITLLQTQLCTIIVVDFKFRMKVVDVDRFQYFIDYILLRLIFCELYFCENFIEFFHRGIAFKFNFVCFVYIFCFNLYLFSLCTIRL